MWTLIFLLISTSVYLILSIRGGTITETADQRLKRLVAQRKLAAAQYQTAHLPGPPVDPDPEAEAKRQRKSIKEKLVGVVDQATKGRRYANTLEVRLQRAGWKWKSAEFMTAQGLLAGCGLGLSLIAAHSLWWLLLFLGWISPHILLSRAERKRLKEFEGQLPDALAIVANALRSGYSFLQAMDVVSREMPDPISGEFGLVIRETRVNIPLEESMGNLVNRVKSPDLDLLVTAVLIQRQVGGNLAEVLDKIAGTIKDRIKMQGEIRTLTTQGRFSGWIVSLLPMALAVIMQLISPGYLNPMLKNPAGWVMIVVGVVMQFIGVMTIRSMVSMEV